MNLILVNSSEIVVGEPLPWPLFDHGHNLLLDQKDVVRDEEHRDALLASGACHELSWEIPDKEDDKDGFFADEVMPTEPSRNNTTGGKYTFDDMKLKVEDRLQLEPPAQLSHERFLVKVIGFLRGASLLVTTPITVNGLRLQLIDGETVVMRSFSGQNAFGFVSTIKRRNMIPYEYMHLSIPDNIDGVVIRKDPRIKTHIITTVHGSKPNGDGQLTALISDISSNGASVDAKQPLGNKGDILGLAFRVHLHNTDAYMSVKGVIRAVLSGDASKPGLIHHGIEFKELQTNDCVILQSMIYQQMIENPHTLA